MRLHISFAVIAIVLLAYQAAGLNIINMAYCGFS